MTRVLGAALLAVFVLGCAPASYTLKLGTNRERWQPSTVLTTSPVLSGLAVQLQKTSQQCGNVRQQLDIELDGRQHALATRKTLLVSVSSAASATAGLYPQIATHPDPRITTIWAAVGAGTVLAMIPALGQDDRIAVLQGKLATISTAEAPVLTDWMNVEAAVSHGLDVTALAVTFRADLVTLGSVCQ